LVYDKQQLIRGDNTIENYYYLLAIAFRIFGLISYIWLALCLAMIAQKLHANYPWLAWIPFANYYLMCKVAKKPIWWIAVFYFAALMVAALVLAFAVAIFMTMGGGDGIPVWLYPILVVTLISVIASSILFVIIWMAIAKARNYPPALGILMIVPVANLVISGVLAFADRPSSAPVENPTV
jgi:hypothetical protein